MIALLIVVHVLYGQTVGQIAATYHTTVAAIMAANPNIRNANVISVGESVNVQPGPGTYQVGGQTVTVAGQVSTETNAPPVPPAPATNSPAQPVGSQPSGGFGESTGWVRVPGMPDSFSRCIEMRESSDNPRSVNSIPGYIGNGGGLFGDLESTWADYGGYPQPFDAPVSVQVQFNSALFQRFGTSPWTSDGCNLNGTVR